MRKIIVQVDGMQCGMCEAHVNDAVRAAFRVKKVTSSCSRGVTEILAEQEIVPEKLREVIRTAGYTVTSMRTEPFEKKGWSIFKGGR